MKFYDLDKLSKMTGITNKYLLTSMLASWARNISEEKSRLLEEGGEKYISMALEDIEKASLIEMEGSKIFLKKEESRGKGNGKITMDEGS